MGLKAGGTDDTPAHPSVTIFWPRITMQNFNENDQVVDEQIDEAVGRASWNLASMCVMFSWMIMQNFIDIGQVVAEI